MTEDRIRLSDWSLPAKVTITQPGQPATVSARPPVSHPLVRRRVIHPDGLDVHGHRYSCGAIIVLKAHDAHLLELSGHLAAAE